MSRNICSWTTLPKNWDSTYWWSGVDIEDRLMSQGLYDTRDDARKFCMADEAVVRVRIHLSRDGGY